MTISSANLELAGWRQGEQRVLLHNVSWTTYEKLLAAFSSQSSVRLSYDEGTLEIMTPLPEHERIKHVAEMILEFLAEELGINLYCLGSTTFKRKDLERGFEPASCFYIKNELKVMGKETIDLAIDPPPDLIIEIDISSESMNKFSIYAKIGVPEVWRHNGNKLLIYKLTGEQYLESSCSLAFPRLNSADLSDLIGQSKNMPSQEFRKLLRKWARTIAE